MKQPLKSGTEAKELLVKGNEAFVNDQGNLGDISSTRRQSTKENGQSPYAMIVTCGDSRVPPEHIFSAGVGDLFVIRNAGHVVDSVELGSLEYATEHLGSRYILVLGHTGCGAVAASVGGGTAGNIKAITDAICCGIGDEKDTTKAEKLNVAHTVKKIKEDPALAAFIKDHGLLVEGAVYDIATGKVNYI